MSTTRTVLIICLILIIPIAIGCDSGPANTRTTPSARNDDTASDSLTRLLKLVFGNWIISDNIEGPYGETLAYLISPILSMKDDITIRTVSAVVFDPGQASLGATFGTIVLAESDTPFTLRLPSISIKPSVKTWNEASSTTDILVDFD